MNEQIKFNKVITKPIVTNNSSSTFSKTGVTGSSFEQVLENIRGNQNEIKFSKHALERLNSRNIEITDIDMKKLNQAIEKAKEKGVKDALILMDDKAFIASIRNKTIVTAAFEDQLKENVFTNIDGAVLV